MKPCALFLSLLLTLVGCPAWAEDEIVTGPDLRNEIDLRIEELDADRAEVSTKGPQTAIYIGLATLLLGVVPLAVGLTADEPWGEDYARHSGGVIAGATLMGIGAVTASLSGIILSERVKQRNEIDVEREWLIEKRDGLAAGLSRFELYSAYRDDTHFVTLGLRF